MIRGQGQEDRPAFGGNSDGEYSMSSNASDRADYLRAVHNANSNQSATSPDPHSMASESQWTAMHQDRLSHANPGSDISAYPRASPDHGGEFTPAYGYNTFAPQSLPYANQVAPSQPYYMPLSAPSMPLAWPTYTGSIPQEVSPVVVSDIPARRRRRKVLLIASIILATVIIASAGGAGYVMFQLSAPASAVTALCQDMRAQDYGSAYGLLSHGMQADLSLSQFGQLSTQLDQIAGKVTACKQAPTAGAYDYSLGNGTATVLTVMTREKQGVLQGRIRLGDEDGEWKVDTLDAALIGVDLHALQVASQYCSAMQNRNYADAYSLLSISMQGRPAGPTAFKEIEDTAVSFDGALSSCVIAGIGQNQSTSQAEFQVTISRTKAGLQTGTMRLALDGQSWKISAMDDQLITVDYRPVDVLIEWCVFLTPSSAGTAYDEFLDNSAKGSMSRDKFVSIFGATDVQWSCGAPDVEHLRSAQNRAFASHLPVLINMDLIATDANFGNSATFHEEFLLVHNADDSWKIAGWDERKLQS